MQSDRSFSIVDEDDDFTYNLDEPSKQNARNIFSAKRKSFDNMTQVKSLMLNDQSDDSADDSLSTDKANQREEMAVQQDKQSHIMTLKQPRIPSPGPSGRQTVNRLNPPPINRELGGSSEESDDSDRTENTQGNNCNKGNRRNNKNKTAPITGEYDPTQYAHLTVNDDVNEVFQYITKYVSQQLTLDLKFRPFIPDFLPAVGDIDAFLKVVHPDQNINGDVFPQATVTRYLANLGLTVLDEPTANQSDPALLHLQLRAHSVTATPLQHTNMVVKKVSNVEKDSKTIDKWIKDITDLHKTKSSPVVKYTDPMPDLDDLMQQWPEKMENQLKLHGFPTYDLPQISLNDYIDIVACIFDIPVHRNKIQTLHLLFSLYATVKIFQQNSANRSATATDEKMTSDQLVLD